MKLFVGNLHKDVTDSQLNALMIRFGKPLTAVISRDDRSGSSKGFGFVEFAEAREGYAAIADLNGQELNGQYLKLMEERAPEPESVPNSNSKEPRWKP